MNKNFFIFFLFLTFFKSVFPQVSSQTFNYTGSFQSFTVPSCISNGIISYTVRGAQGGGSGGGLGAQVTGTLSVTVGQVLRVYVGGQGSCPGSGGGAGWNGGANAGFQTASSPPSNPFACGGGGASDIRVSPYGLSNRVVVAGGGGGTGSDVVFDPSWFAGGGGGCPNGSSGASFYAIGGGGGTTSSGGLGGAPWCSPCGQAGSDGSLAIGGKGGDDIQTIYAAGGGGGGGLYGGGGGGADGCCVSSNGGAGGGGGSSLVPGGAACIPGTWSGNGQVILSWTCSVLPIELLYFRAEPLLQNGKKLVLLKWETQVQINNDYFIIERSREGSAWEELIKVKGEGTFMQPKSYEVKDLNPYDGISYYRLRQVDYDGNYSYSYVLSVHFNSFQVDEFVIFRNEDGSFTLINENKCGDFELLDITGKVLQKYYFDNQKNIFNINLSSGIYFIRQSKDGKTQKIVIH